MKKIIHISLIFCFGFKFADISYDLEKGKNKVVYDEGFSDYPKFQFEISGQKLTEINSDKNRSYKIELIGENAFQLKSFEKEQIHFLSFKKA